MKIEFDADEVKAIILAAAQKYNAKLNTVKLDGSYSFSGATVTYVDPVETERAAAELAAYRLQRDEAERSLSLAAVNHGMPA